MTINLSGVSFTNDMYYLSVRRRSTLLLNRVDEWLKTEQEIEWSNEAKIKRINIEIINNEDGSTVRCPSIIGLSNDLMALKSDYAELEGQVLTEDNKDKCYIVVAEEE